MRQATMMFNRQVIRLAKGVIKAWEQWVDDVELESINVSSNSKVQILEGDHDGTKKGDHDRAKKR
jgi:hypothetical protein